MVSTAHLDILPSVVVGAVAACLGSRLVAGACELPPVDAEGIQLLLWRVRRQSTRRESGEVRRVRGSMWGGGGCELPPMDAQRVQLLLWRVEQGSEAREGLRVGRWMAEEGIRGEKVEHRERVEHRAQGARGKGREGGREEALRSS